MMQKLVANRIIIIIIIITIIIIIIIINIYLCHTEYVFNLILLMCSKHNGMCSTNM
jgi:hypothetical protein